MIKVLIYFFFQANAYAEIPPELIFTARSPQQLRQLETADLVKNASIKTCHWAIAAKKLRPTCFALSEEARKINFPDYDFTSLCLQNLKSLKNVETIQSFLGAPYLPLICRETLLRQQAVLKYKNSEFPPR